nr:Chain E, Endoglucanase D [Clostridium cellulovorans]3NDY_F Chain F, Endoglucanase D [Clostridium cellulovorans]3NDY_G Chain G, Endoglucanase D [Clostridium cellulovorans]3NDY_H Chain H, Endoglucanase D [Clostridium cellulovorans]3NDZ_E Chain E, Endoglucanase D [Clostridium cellulovorans]3NDZ_F Chain F, Endoglucanase D [Clostridium cellulovorans]3NDZ_G Chain G, Endoglucanase D [Clostridium cellulovorans]3NDZ_H Chain H, Endoglucanase D [Clostridium cellulovorans]
SAVEVTYAITNSWGSGASVNVTIKNNGTTPINGWTLKWTMPINQTITNMWSASFVASGTTLSVTNAGYNGTIAANGGTQSFGFNINYSGVLSKPTGFTVNGTECTVK